MDRWTSFTKQCTDDKRNINVSLLSIVFKNAVDIVASVNEKEHFN